jgi:hypothetical protein
MKSEINTDTQTKHTPLPWIVCPRYVDRCVYPIGVKKNDNVSHVLGEISSLGGTEEQCKANAAFIVQACNAHYEMLRCLERLEIAFSNRPTSEDEPFWDAWSDLPNITTKQVQESCLSEARAAILKAQSV